MISVIVPVYRVEPYLRQCVESILNQTYRDIEVLLIDDGSPDRCGEICNEYSRKDNRVRVFHTENRGLSAARNLGISAARGEYVGFVDSDDWIEPDMYEVLLRRIEEAEAEISICGIWYETVGTREKLQFQDSVNTGIESLGCLIDGSINNGVWNKLYRIAMFHNISFPDGKNYEDVAVMHKIIYRADKVATDSSIKYHYRIRHESITKTYTAKNLIDYADSHISRYYFFKNEGLRMFEDRHDELLRYAASGISKVWRWWYQCNKEDREKYKNNIEDLRQFSCSFILRCWNKSWPKYLQFSVVFMHSSSTFSFACLFYANQAYRALFPKQSNLLPD